MQGVDKAKKHQTFLTLGHFQALSLKTTWCQRTFSVFYLLTFSLAHIMDNLIFVPLLCQLLTKPYFKSSHLPFPQERLFNRDQLHIFFPQVLQNTQIDLATDVNFVLFHVSHFKLKP